jgi:hypothetical protein
MSTEHEAVEIVRKEIARGWSPGELLSQAVQRLEGCDFFSIPPEGAAARGGEGLGGTAAGG